MATSMATWEETQVACTHRRPCNRYCHPPVSWRLGCGNGTADALGLFSPYRASPSSFSSQRFHLRSRPRRRLRGRCSWGIAVGRQSRSVDGAGRRATGGRLVRCSGKRSLVGCRRVGREGVVSDWREKLGTGTAGVPGIAEVVQSEEDAVLGGPSSWRLVKELCYQHMHAASACVEE